MQYFFSWPVVYLYTSFIFLISLLPIETPLEIAFPFMDKWMHFLMYALLSLIILNTSFLKKKTHPYLFSLSYVFFLGLIIEFIQFLLPYRNFELADVLFNILGALAGLPFKLTGGI